MGEIGINVRYHWSFNFDWGDRGVIRRSFQHCYYCLNPLDKVYSYIINTLKDGGLLDKDYRQICCYCKVLKKFGLIDIRKYLSSFYYDEPNDILIITFRSDQTEEGKLTPKYYVNIHDFSKIKDD